MNENSNNPIPNDALPVNPPPGSMVVKNGKYLRIINAEGYPISSLRGRIPYHRFVLFEKLGKPDATRCNWCGYVLPWTSTAMSSMFLVINADHLDGDTHNNQPENLVPSCAWCNANRSWAEQYPEFWSNWRRWMKHVPPMCRPNLAEIASEFNIEAFPDSEGAN